MAIKYAEYLRGQTDDISFIPPQATESMRGGIIAKAKTDETVEVVVDTATGKAYVPAYPETIDAAKVVEDAENRFVTDEQITTWSEGVTYTNDMPTVTALGGIAAGTTFDNMSVTDVLNKLLYPYIKPVVSATSSPNGGTYEKGEEVAVTKITVNVTKKSEPITKVEVFDGTTSLGVREDGATGAVVFDLTDVKVSSNKNFTAKVTDKAGEVVSATTGSFSFIYPFYRGVINEGVELTEELVEGLTKDLSAKATKTYAYTAGNQRMVIAYPKSYGALKSIKDPNNFEVLDTWTQAEVSTTTNDGLTTAYYVYTSKLVTVENYSMKFSF